MWNNYIAGKEWYSKVDPENTEQVRDFCERRGYSTEYYIVVNTPLGRHTINKNSYGSLSFMGMTAKLISAKNGVYKVKTSLGTFSVNTRRATITKL